MEVAINFQTNVRLNLFFFQMFSDRNILEPLETSAKMQAESCSSPVYYYIFGYAGNNRIAHMTYPNVPSDGQYSIG